jgi:drug/metabolite transporter (DMT)-like permease
MTGSAIRSKWIVYSKLTLTAVLWGGTFIAGRILAEDVAPFSAAFLRFVLASIILFALLLKGEGQLPHVTAKQIISLILLGMSGIFAYNFFFLKGLKLIHANRASLIVANNPVFIALFARLLFKEPLSFLKVLGILLSISGAFVVISRGSLEVFSSGHLGWGDLYIFGCVASWVTYSLIGKMVMSGLSPLSSVTYSSAIGCAALFLPACLEGIFLKVTHYPLTAWLCVFYLGFFGTVLGFVWYYQGIQAIGPTRAGQFINFVPVSAVLLAHVILDEPISVSLCFGGILVVLGVYLTSGPFSR